MDYENSCLNNNLSKPFHIFKNHTSLNHEGIPLIKHEGGTINSLKRK